MARSGSLEALRVSDPAAYDRVRAQQERYAFRPHSAGQAAVLNDETRFIVVRAGRRYGKTKVAARKIIRKAMRNPDKVVWWVANAQPLDEPVLTPQGWTTMGALEVGDEVIGSDGRPTEVLGVFPQGLRAVYEVELSDGSVVRASGDHLWTVETPTGRARQFEKRTISTRELARFTEPGRRARIHNVAPVRFEQAALPIEPYALGALLGDGHLPAQGTPRFANTDPHIVAEVERSIPLVRYDDGQYGASGNGGLRQALRDLGLAGTRSATKFVPQDYLHGSVEQRLAMLQGLMDTDGSVRRGSGFVFVSTSPMLAEDVRALVLSLGGSATINPDGRRWVVQGGFSAESGINPFRTPRKADRFKPSRHAGNVRLVVAVRELDERVPMQCIRVAAADSLYVTKHYTLSHNTYKNTRRGYREVLRQLPPNFLAKPAPPPTANDLILTLKNGTRIEFYSGTNPDAMAGEGVFYVVVDEAALQSEVVWTQTIRPTLMDYGGGALLISTPRGRNWFHGMARRGEDPQYPEYASYHFPTSANPLVKPEEIEEARLSLPEVMFRQEILAEFIAGAASIFSIDEDHILPGVVDFEPGMQIIMGVDLAKQYDFTVIDAIRVSDRKPVYHDRFNQIRWPDQQDLIENAVRDLEARGGQVTVAVDATGVGDVVFDDLEDLGLDVVPLKYSAPWKNQAVKLLSADLARGGAWLLEEQVREFEDYEYRITPAGNFIYSAPEGGHDDEVAAKLNQHWVLVHDTLEFGIREMNIGPQNRDVDAEREASTEAQVEGVVRAPRPEEDLLNDPSVWS